MPASHKLLSNWYSQLADQLEAGLDLPEALRLSNGPPQDQREHLAANFESGTPPKDALRDGPIFLPCADRMAITAACESGRLPDILHRLSERHASIGSVQLKVILGLAYPIAIYHLVALLMPLAGMIDFDRGFSWHPGVHFAQMLAMILPVWLIAGSFFYLSRTEHPLLPRILRRIPLLGVYQRAQAIADFAHSLGTLLEAGVPIARAWKLSVEAVNHPGLHAAHTEIQAIFANGQDPSEALSKHRCFPADLVAFYRSGGRTGKLDEAMNNAAKQSQVRANNTMTVAAIIYPTLLFIAVAIIVALGVIRMYGGYLDGIQNFIQ